jgi:hypothetical protein
MPNRANLSEFTARCAKHIAGDEKRQAQMWCCLSGWIFAQALAVSLLLKRRVL